MPCFRHILFPVDFSKQNCDIAPYVACLATRYGAQVTLLHVMETPSLVYPGWPAFDFQALVAEKRERVDSFLKSEFQGLAVTRLMREGDPALSLVEYAEKESVDLIMLPTHGYGPFRRFILGSLTAKILHDAKCVVWTSAHAVEPPPAPPVYRNVLCAVDLSASSLPLIRWAAGFTHEQGAILKLVHVIPAAGPQAGLDIEGGRFRSYLFDIACKELTSLREESGVRADVVLEGGGVADCIRRAAEQNQTDLLIIGRGAIQERFGRLRTHVYSIIREAPCPVLSVPRDADGEAPESFYG